MMITIAGIALLKRLRGLDPRVLQPHLAPGQRLQADLRGIVALLQGAETRLSLGLVDHAALEEAARRLGAARVRAGQSSAPRSRQLSSERGR